MSVFTGKSLIGIELYYIETINRHRHSTFHFIRSAQDMANWKTKGYYTEDEMSVTTEVNKGVKREFDPNKKINKITTSWKRLSWGEQNSLISKSLKTSFDKDGKQVMEIDNLRFRDLKLKMCLKDWTIMDDQGVKMPVTEDNIDLLVPDVAHELVSLFENVTERGADELKN